MSTVVVLWLEIVTAGSWIGSSVINVKIISCPTVASVESEKLDLYDKYVIDGGVFSMTNLFILALPSFSFPARS